MGYGKIRRWYNENKGKIWLVVVIAIGIIFFVQVLNNYYNNKNQGNVIKTTLSNTTNLERINENLSSGKAETSTSAISGIAVSSEKLEQATKIIDIFIGYCNDKKIEEAYSILTDECKEVFYPTINDFKEIYYDDLYSSEKTYKLQNWAGNTYKVTLMEDALSTGMTGANLGTYQDYITIVNKNGINKININSYIGRTNINKTTTKKDIVFNVMYKDTFMDYETYNIDIKNLSGKTILLDDGESTKSIVIQDDNSISSYVYTGEIMYSDLDLKNGQEKIYEFKFANSYTVTRIMRYIIFERVITDYEQYKENKEIYQQIEKIYVNV